MPKSVLLEKYGSVFDEIQSMQLLSDSEKEALIDRILSSEYIDLTSDFGFRYVFGNHLNLLKMFLEDLLHLKIKSLERIPEEVVGTYVQDKYIIMDVGVVLTDGRRIVVEMQNSKTGDLKNRLVYYGAALIYNQLKRGADVYEYGNVHVLMFLNEHLDHDDPDDCRLVYRYQMREAESGECYGNQLQITVCELPNLVKGSKDPMNVTEQWVYYLRNMKKFTTLSGGPKVLDERYRPLIEASKTRRLTDEEWKNYIKAMYTKEELDNLTKPYYEDGFRKGERMGREEGREEGAAQKSAEIAKAMLTRGYDHSTVRELTGITDQEIEDLSKPES